MKPILKWVGGKSQIIDKLIPKFPTEIDNYYEPFLGGGSVLLALLSHIKAGKIVVRGSIYASDLNEALVYVYKNIQKQHLELFELVSGLIKDYNSCGNGELNRNPSNLEEALLLKENYYYWTRIKYNNLHDKKSVLASAMFIFLNKTCFRGLFRVGPNGFNVPYGNYKNPEILNLTCLEEIHILIQPVIFDSCDFREALAKVKPSDFVYLDPPYVPDMDTSFVKYTENGFVFKDHQDLFDILLKQDARFILSNSDTKLVRDSFEKYDIISISCRRAINSKNPNSKAQEVIICK